MMDRLMIFLDFMAGSAWLLSVGELICLVNSDNERDPSHLTSRRYQFLVARTRAPLSHGERRCGRLLRGTNCAQQWEAWGKCKSVMLLHDLGRSRATMAHTASPTFPERGG